jgi:hypothetical protein
MAVRGRAYGVLIDERNRCSLSRLQMLLWTALLIVTLHVVFVSNVLRASATAQTPANAAQTPNVVSVVKALDVNFDWNLMVLMGLSIASYLSAPLALSRKAEAPTDTAGLQQNAGILAQEQKLQRPPSSQGNLLVKESSADARLADLVRGEEVSNAVVVDLPRMQMLLVTVVVVLTYATGLVALLAGHEPVIAKLPELNATLLMLIAVSHGGYLVGKLLPTTTGDNANAQPRAMLASQQAAGLVGELQAVATKLPAGDTRAPALQNALALARIAAADAAALAGSASGPGLRAEELTALEARVRTLKEGLAAWIGGPAAAGLAAAPAPSTVQAVQQALGAYGYVLSVNGIIDAATEQALRQELARLGLERQDLHPEWQHFLEEMLPLIGRPLKSSPPAQAH